MARAVHVAMVDLLLESQLDLAKATEHAIVATTAPCQRTRPQAEPSWHEAAYDIHLRQGIVSLSMAASTPPSKDSSRRDSCGLPRFSLTNGSPSSPRPD